MAPSTARLVKSSQKNFIRFQPGAFIQGSGGILMTTFIFLASYLIFLMAKLGQRFSSYRSHFNVYCTSHDD